MTELVRRWFDPTPEAVTAARRFVRDALIERVEGPVEEEMVLALGELAANAVRHAQTPFEVVVEVNGLVRLEVLDSGPGLPIRRPVSTSRPDGRGLLILDGVCDTWGVHVVEDHKCVWCERQLP